MLTLDREYLKSLLIARENDSHKRIYGHLLLVCGSSPMPGAAILSVSAALKSGCGLVTLHSSKDVCLAAVSQCPSAMLSFGDFPDNLSKYSAIGIGPGLGMGHPEALYAVLKASLPTVLDADALNMLSSAPNLLKEIPRGSVMTPHAGELSRLLLSSGLGNEVELSSYTNCVVVSKGYHTKIYSPKGEVFENTTGNPGMAKGGSGDVLTGLIAGLMARGYSALDASSLGVWIHGLAGDILTEKYTAEAYSSRDLIDELYNGFLCLER